MTMTLDANSQRFGPLHLEHMSSYQNQPHFTNPWVPSSQTGAPSQSGNPTLYVSNHSDAHAPSDGLPRLNLTLPTHPHHPSRTSAGSNSSSMASYAAIPVTTAGSAATPLVTDMYGRHNSLSMNPDASNMSRLHPASSAAYGDPAYTTSTSPGHVSYAASPTPYDHLGYAPAPVRGAFALAPDPDQSRRYSHHLPSDDRRGFQDALEASHGMLSMSQETPRNIYDIRNRSRGSADYGFPATHSTHSSISSNGLASYYGGSVDSSVSDYSTAGSDLESLSGRTLPRPQGLITNQAPPAPQSMMGQFSSKMAPSTQKKHKCRVCDKRFTRPSSLQTHMYSHTGEKPFMCEVEGCGRHFSVVSNLRRHLKVHKNQPSTQADTPSDAGSEDRNSE